MARQFFGKQKQYGYEIDEDFRHGGKTVEWSWLYSQILRNFAERTPLMTPQQYTRHVWGTLFPMTAFFETQKFKDKIQEIRKRTNEDIKQGTKLLIRQVHRPLTPDEKIMVKTQVEYDNAAEAWLEINRLINDRLGEEQTYTETIGDDEDDDNDSEENLKNDQALIDDEDTMVY